jgi:protein-glucosylgalactosylhydroxylysine glucosidase
MMDRITALAHALLPVLLLFATADAEAEDPSFLLTAGPADLASYFPAYLANGYFSTFSTPRGTEAARSYMAGLMDYTPGDMTRPAAVPGWTEIDFNPSAPGVGQAWLDRVPMSDRHFRDYQQTLDLHAGTLMTRYHFSDHGRDTAVEVTTLVSEASPHVRRAACASCPTTTAWCSYPLRSRCGLTMHRVFRSRR